MAVKQKVLFIINDLRMGGAQRVLSIVMRELVRCGYDVALITNHSASSDFYKIEQNIGRYTTALFNPSANVAEAVMNNLRRVSRIRKIISKESPDVVFSFMTETNILAILATLLSDTRVIVSERSDPEKEKKSFIWELLRKITYRNADLVTSNSKASLGYLASMVKREKLVFLPNPVEGCSEASIPGEDRESAKILLVVSRLHPAKGIDILIEALAVLKSKGKEYQLWIAGDGPEKENLHAQAKDVGVAADIRWLGGVSELVPLYKKASLFILPSRMEGMPNALLEAMSCGLPVVTSNASPGPLEYVVHGETGLVFESESSSSLAAVIDEIMGDDAERYRMATNSIDKVKPFLCSNVIPEWEKIIFQRHSAGSDAIVR